MGFMNIFKGQFIDIVQWEEETPGVLVHRFERHNNEIKNNAKLIVRPGQMAVFVNEGQIADHFEPGTYVLSTANVPILTSLLSLPTNFESWHKAEVYFVKTTEQLDIKWGTPQPVMMRDMDFGVVRLRANGNYSYRIGTTNGLLERFVGSRDEFTADELQGQISAKVVSEFSDSLGELKIPALDLAASYNEIGDRVKLNLNKVVEQLGLEVMSFTVTNITLPDAVNEAMDRRGSIGIMGGMNQYMQAQAADAMRDAANNTGNAGTMMGMMIGGQLGGLNQGMMNQGMMNQQPQYQQQYQQPVPPPQQQAPQMPPPPPPMPSYYVAINGGQQGPFNMQQLQGMVSNGTLTPGTFVWTAGMASWQAASTVAALGVLFGAVPPPPPPMG